MSEAPERITAWLSKDGSTRFEGGRLFPAGVEVEYVRADRIEELEADLAYWQKDSADAWDKCEENRVKLAKAVEALERIEDASKYFGNCPEASETTVRYAHETTRRLARTTLAELTSSVAADNEVKGGKDE